MSDKYNTICNLSSGSLFSAVSGSQRAGYPIYRCSELLLKYRVLDSNIQCDCVGSILNTCIIGNTGPILQYEQAGFFPVKTGNGFYCFKVEFYPVVYCIIVYL